MILTIAHFGNRASRSGDKARFEELVRLYFDRISAWHTIQSEVFSTETDFLSWMERQRRAGRVPIFPVLLESRGKGLSSREFAAWLGARRDQGVQHIVFAIGPADGWSAAALELVTQRGGMLLSLGPMTMAHELARLVLAEQIYRACTILAGHPYHTGH